MGNKKTKKALHQDIIMDGEWVLDYVLTLLQSPSWEVPIMIFVDENCIVFDTEDENKFVYTDLHAEFKELVETILETHLAEMGVDSQMFALVCEAAGTSDEISTQVLTQLYALDDFITFKRLMIQRNVELELEALKALQEDSIDTVKENDKKTTKAMEANLWELELLQQEETLELAELETALALSLQMEEERVERLTDSKKSKGADAKEHPLEKERKSSKASRNENDMKANLNLNSAGKTSTALIVYPSDAKTAQVQVAVQHGRKELSASTLRREEYVTACDVSQEDIELRKRHLREQRDRILAKRNKEREQKLQDHNDKTSPVQDLQEETSSESKSTEPDVSAVSDADERRKALRITLAKRMKQDMMESEDVHASSRQVQQFKDFDHKLRQVENLRRENRIQEDSMFQK